MRESQRLPLTGSRSRNPVVILHAHRASVRASAAIALFLLACLVLSVTFVLRGCMNEHSRAPGPGYPTFGINPRGDAIVFSAVGEGGLDLYFLDLRTHEVTRIAATPDYEVDPEFSPNGKSVAFAAGKPSDRADHIFIRSLDGQTAKQLTAEDANDAAPAFSPDGSFIVFTRDKTYNWGGLASNWDWGGVLCVMNADGTGLRQITRDETIAIDPHFCPDGKTILFWSDDGLYTVASDGSRPPTTLGRLHGQQAAYSPDGRSIAFSMGRYAPDHRIFVAKADGTELKRLAISEEGQPARPGGGSFQPAITPDGKRILYFLESWPDGATGHPKESLWEMDIDGGHPREIAGYHLFDDPLNWRPKPPSEKVGP
jgi:Tol biopolymer transport system component